MNKKKLKNISAQLILAAGIKKGLKTRIISGRLNLFQLFYKKKSVFIKGTSMPVNTQSACFIANNKFLTKRILGANNIPMPKSWLVRTPAEAKRLLATKDNFFPCVIKPAKGAHGHKVFANIESKQEFNDVLPLVFDKAGSNDVLIEQFVRGKDYRLLVVGDKVSAVIERIPAHVIGDGKNNIRQLINKFNRQPLVGKKYEKPLCKIKINGEVKRNLKKQAKKLTYIPLKNEKVFLRQNANISTGGISKDATDSVSNQIKEVAVKAAQAIGIKITGVDLIYNALNRKFWILELNDCPGIDIHHYPILGRSRPVAEDIVDFIFKTALSK